MLLVTYMTPKFCAGLSQKAGSYKIYFNVLKLYCLGGFQQKKCFLDDFLIQKKLVPEYDVTLVAYLPPKLASCMMPPTPPAPPQYASYMAAGMVVCLLRFAVSSSF